jgi:hypothetical protein
MTTHSPKYLQRRKEEEETQIHHLVALLQVLRLQDAQGGLALDQMLTLTVLDLVLTLRHTVAAQPAQAPMLLATVSDLI